LDTTFESKILSLLSRRRIIHGLTATVTCEEAEREVLQDKKNFQPDEGSSGAAFQSSPPNGTKAASEPSRTRERCRQAARRLAARGEILITQDGKAVDPSFAKGVIELKLAS
jgi:hypothetical protein